MAQFGWFILDFWLTNPILVGSSFLILFYLDAKLTRVGYSLSKQEYFKHFKQDIYELNPLHQESIHFERPFKRRAWLGWIFLIILFIFLSELYREMRYFQSNTPWIMIPEIILGMFFWIYIDVVKDHLASIMSKRHIIKYPKSVQGEIYQTRNYLYGISRGRIFGTGVICLLVFILVGHPFFLGGFLGSLLVRRWITGWKREIEEPRKPSRNHKPFLFNDPKKILPQDIPLIQSDLSKQLTKFDLNEPIVKRKTEWFEEQSKAYIAQKIGPTEFTQVLIEVAKFIDSRTIICRSCGQAFERKPEIQFCPLCGVKLNRINLNN
ncbi:MAG: hypothetical protein ACFFFH_15665 [Candidatus Thorarchaeota archaeon]